MSKVRLDQLVYDLGYADSREKAKTAIKNGSVFVNGKMTDKPGLQVESAVSVEVRGDVMPFVSRGGYKLDKALKVFPVDPEKLVCIDCGASTGGFTDVLLQHGALKVYSADVGYGQLAPKLRDDPRVVNLERTNLRYITEETLPEKPDLAVMDVSFISVRLILPALKTVLKPGADIICLIKPQFEAGPEDVGKKGVVKDPEVHKRVINEILDFCPSCGYSVMALDFSPVRGPEGNIEYLCYLKNGSYDSPKINVEDVVKASHANFS